MGTKRCRWKEWREAFQESAKSFKRTYRLYWRSYGGIQALITSYYLWGSFIVSSVIFWPVWGGKSTCDSEWYDMSLSILPSLLGLTIAAYAILMSFGSEKYMKAISGDFGDGKPSPFMQANGAFLHFIVVEVIALFAAMVGKVWEVDTGFWGWLGFTTLCYAILSCLAAAAAIMTFADIYDEISNMEDDD